MQCVAKLFSDARCWRGDTPELDDTDIVESSCLSLPDHSMLLKLHQHKTESQGNHTGNYHLTWKIDMDNDVENEETTSVLSV